jgi:hypothetical protein
MRNACSILVGNREGKRSRDRSKRRYEHNNECKEMGWTGFTWLEIETSGGRAIVNTIINEDGCLLGCSAVQSGRSSPTFQVEAASTSESLVNFYQTTRRYKPEESHLRTHRWDYLKR